MKISEIQDEWTKDAKINETDLGKESTNIPKLHAKYLNILSTTRLQYRKAEADYYRMRRKKFRYYRGEMTREELEEEGWNQWQGAKPLKNEMDEILNCDEDLLILGDKQEYFKTTVYQLEQILKSINSRTWDVKNTLEWLKFTNGLM